VQAARRRVERLERVAQNGEGNRPGRKAARAEQAAGLNAAIEAHLEEASTVAGFTASNAASRSIAAQDCASEGSCE
jgi:hypothetical protein